MRRWLWNRRMRRAGRPPITDVEWAILSELPLLGALQCNPSLVDFLTA